MNSLTENSISTEKYSTKELSLLIKFLPEKSSTKMEYMKVPLKPPLSPDKDKENYLGTKNNL